MMIWIVMTEKFVASQTVPVLDVGMKTNQARLFQVSCDLSVLANMFLTSRLKARVFALVWVSAHILFRAPSKWIITKLFGSIGEEVIDDVSSEEKDVGEREYQVPSFPV